MEYKLSFQISPLAYSSRAEYLTTKVLNCSESGVSDKIYCSEEIIVSLTTHGRRLYEVYLAIESIMQQTMKPNRIILWLSDELKNSSLPLVLQKQQKRGLDIRYCKDILTYTKLIPALKAFPQAVIITIDDDCLYHFDLIENLFNAYYGKKRKGKESPKLVHCARMHRMKLIDKNTLEKYKKWELNYSNFDISPLNFPTGVGGVLYPPNCFNEEVFNEKVFMDICKYADDVWFKSMALLNGTHAQKIYTHNKNGEDYLDNLNVQDIRAGLINWDKEMNDVQLKAVFDKYNLYDRLIESC